MEFINLIWPYVSDHPYIFLFLGMLIGGESFLLPAVYLAARGTIHFHFVIILAALSTLLSDTMWYALGRFFSLEKILLWRMFSGKREATLKIFSVWKKHGLKLLFISKFVYGTRTMAQVLSGAVRIPYLRYSIVNLAGILSYLAAILMMALLAKGGLASFEKMPYNEYVSVLVFILLVGIVHICLKKWLGKNFVASSSQPGTKNEQ